MAVVDLELSSRLLPLHLCLHPQPGLRWMIGEAQSRGPSCHDLHRQHRFGSFRTDRFLSRRGVLVEEDHSKENF